MQPPASTSWHREYIQRSDDETGVGITQLTSAPLIHENIYPATPVFTPDSRCFVYSRRQAPDMPREYWLADTASLHVRRLTDEANAKGPVISPDGRWMYYLVETDVLELKRVCLKTFERETVMATDIIRDACEMGTIRHDGLACITSGSVGRNEWGVVKLDLRTRKAKVIFRNDQICNAHPQYAPGPSNDVLIHENHGCKFDDEGRLVAPSSGYGADLHVIDDDGGNMRDVSLGRSDLEMIQGHQGWAGLSGKVLSTLVRRDTPDDAFRSDRIVTVTPGMDDREIVGLGRDFAHPSVSADGNWWVCDEFDTADLFIGSMTTARYALLLHTNSSFGSPRYTHPHPVFSPDATRVVFNSDATGIPHVCIAWLDSSWISGLND